jgi:hypothetical protein
VSDEVLVITETATEVVEVVAEPIEVIEIATGLQGPPGVAGPGVPAGGGTGEVLAKASPTDFDTEWLFLGGGGGGSGYVPQDPHVSPQLVAADLTAGGSQSLDADAITPGKTGRLMAVDVGSATPCRVDIQIIDGVRMTIASLYFQAGQSVRWEQPYPTFWQLLGDGAAKFGVTVINLGGSEPSDVRVTIFWDEV